MSRAPLAAVRALAACALLVCGSGCDAEGGAESPGAEPLQSGTLRSEPLLEYPTPRPHAPWTARCGDGDLALTEQCDDGNTVAADGCSASCRIESSGEFHPRLIFTRNHVPALRQKLGAGTIPGPLGAALVGALKGQRSEEAIAFIDETLAGDEPDLFPALLAFDLQHGFLTDGERSRFRSAFLERARAIYARAATRNDWFFRRRTVNNWTYRPARQLLATGVLFTDDPQASGFRSMALELLTWIFEGSLNDGIWDPEAREFARYPRVGDMIDESAASPNAYGVWGSHQLNELMHVAALNTDFDPYGKLDQMTYSEGRYWTYLLSFEEGIRWDEDGWSSQASYIGQTGHGSFRHLRHDSNSHLLHWARVYREPVFAWHYYANPAPGPGRPEGYLRVWDQPRSSHPGWLAFLDWGAIGPEDPEAAGWPLTGYWPEAGIGVIRKSWHKKGPGSGVVWLRAGKGASHDRPATGAVQYHADDHVLLGGGPHDYKSKLVTIDARMNNTLFVDGHGQVGFYSLSLGHERRAHGECFRLGPDTFLMSMSKEDRPDFLSLYAHLPFEVDWTRKVHFDRERDILWIKDVASTGDGAEHDFGFNWISDAKVRTADTYDLPGGYVMVADSDRDIVAEARTYAEGTKNELRAVWAGGRGPSIRMWWAIGRDEGALRRFVARRRGVFIRDVDVETDAGGLRVTWRTDEPSLGRVELGPATSPRGAAESSTRSSAHEVRLPGLTAPPPLLRIVATDSHGDETVEEVATPPPPAAGSGPARP